MKTALYFRDGTAQLVLTPETDWERNALDGLTDAISGREAKVFRGGFYDCAGGWVRQGKTERSLIVRFDQ